jgi:hypothetical protein
MELRLMIEHKTKKQVQKKREIVTYDVQKSRTIVPFYFYCNNVLAFNVHSTATGDGTVNC